MARITGKNEKTGRRVLLVDDDHAYLEITGRLLEKEGHEVTTASSGPEALEILNEEFFDLVLVDYYMPGMTGEELITAIRKTNTLIQIVLQTGYANEQPPRDLVKRLDIQGYFNKSEGPDKLLLWVDVGLKAAYNLQLLHRSREGLRYILGVTPDLHRIRSLDELLQGILLQVAGLLGATDSFLAVMPITEILEGGHAGHPEGFVATVDEDARFQIRAGTGRFVERRALADYFDPSDVDSITQALENNCIVSNGNANIVPLAISEIRIGVIYLNREIDEGANAELLRVFANQAAVAIHNTRLYEMATLDPLTRVFQRGMLMQAFQRELRVSYRSGEALCLVMIDVDRMKEINDSMGHLAGDKALRIIGQAMNYATRQTDIRGRMGGDEFAIILVGTGEQGADIVMERICTFLESQKVEGNGTSKAVGCSMGACCISQTSGTDGVSLSAIDSSYFELMAMLMIKQADDALYEEKRSGTCFGAARQIPWETPENEEPPDLKK